VLTTFLPFLVWRNWIKFKVNYFYSDTKIASRVKDKMPEVGSTARFCGILYRIKEVYSELNFVNVQLAKE